MRLIHASIGSVGDGSRNRVMVIYRKWVNLCVQLKMSKRAGLPLP